MFEHSRNRLKRRSEAQALIDCVLANRRSALTVHYSSQGFIGDTQTSSPHVNSIAIRNIGTGQTVSFSLNLSAELRGYKEITTKNLQELERDLLDSFYEFVRSHIDYQWVHWNMRDANFGFPALAHRYRALGGTPVDIPESNLIDLARLLMDCYGEKYAPHPRLTSLARMNYVNLKSYLTGQEESEAFVSGDYTRAHQSTLRKVDLFDNILTKVHNGTLETEARPVDIYGSYLAYGIELVRDHWLVTLIGLIAAVLGIISVILGWWK